MSSKRGLGKRGLVGQQEGLGREVWGAVMGCHCGGVWKGV